MLVSFPFKGKVGMGMVLKVKSKAPPSKSSPSGEEFTAKALKKYGSIEEQYDD